MARNPRTYRLENKTALVTGGTRGIGLAIAQEFCREGAQVVVAGTHAGRGKEIVREQAAQGYGMMFEHVDMANVDSIKEMVGAAATRLFGIDVLVNNAGITARGTINSLTEDGWDEVQAVNLRGPVFCMQAVRPHMAGRKNGGSIINIASIAGLDAPFGKASYAAAKAGLIAAGQVAAKEFARDNVRVNTIAPGMIETDMLATISSNHLAGFVGNTPLDRVGSPAEIASACAFLATDAAQFITGTVLRIDGGLRL